MQNNVLDTIESLREEMKNSLMKMITIPAIGPGNDGDGETKRADFLMELIEDFGFDSIERYDAEDERTSSGIRPNIIATKKGKTDRNVLVIAHMDIVPEGDLDLWDTDPYEPVFKDGKIYGRGAEDNGQEVIAALYAAKALTLSGITPLYTLKVILVSDEETGSKYGVKHILDKGLVSPDDIVVVPDHSQERGRKIEIAEKSGLWVKIVAHGKQGHGAAPGSAINANRMMAKYQNRVDELLHEMFDLENGLFSPPVSTFEPTKREKNVPNVNTIPGKEVQYFDCRVIPEIPLDEVKSVFEDTVETVTRETGGEIEIIYETDKEAPPGTPEDAEVVLRLRSAIHKVMGFQPGVCGIGGGTVAALFRRIGMPAAVWATSDCVPHQPNEYAVLDYMVNDCKVFATMVTED